MDFSKDMDVRELGVSDTVANVVKRIRDGSITEQELDAIIIDLGDSPDAVWVQISREALIASK